jgi:hypothetical protein
MIVGAASGYILTGNGIGSPPVYVAPKFTLLDTNNGTSTSTTSETVTKTLLIPANTFGSGKAFTIKARALRTATHTVVYDSKLYFNTSAGIGGSPIQVALYTSALGSGSVFAQLERACVIKSATNTQVIVSNVTLSIDDTSNGVSSLNIDWTVDQYLVFTVRTTAATNIITGQFLMIKEI